MGKKFVTKENLDDNLKEYTKEVVKPLINNDSYLSRAKKLNTDNDFTEESNFIYGIDNIAGGGEELKQANLNFSLMSIYSFSSKLDVEDTDESRENCRKLILENIEEVFSKNNLLDEPKTLSQTNGWFFDKTDMNFQKGTKSPNSFYITFHKYTPITIKNATIIGKGLKSTNDGNVVLGQYNKTTDAAFVIGNGTASDNSDAVVITNTGDLHVSNIYIKDNLFNPDYSEVDANKSSYILNKPIFTDGLLSENCLDESVSIVEGSNKDITITLSQDISKYSKILFTQVFNANDANSCGVSDLLKTDIGTTIFSTSSGYGLMNITLDKIEGNTIQISYDTNYFSSKVTTFFTIDAYLNYVKINVNSTEDKTFGYNPSKNEWQEIEEPTTKISNESDNALVEKEDGLFVQQSEGLQQVEILPEDAVVGDTYQYVGENTNDYASGHIYKYTHKEETITYNAYEFEDGGYYVYIRFDNDTVYESKEGGDSKAESVDDLVKSSEKIKTIEGDKVVLDDGWDSIYIRCEDNDLSSTTETSFWNDLSSCLRQADLNDTNFTPVTNQIIQHIGESNSNFVNGYSYRYIKSEYKYYLFINSSDSTDIIYYLSGTYDAKPTDTDSWSQLFVKDENGNFVHCSYSIKSFTSSGMYSYFTLLNRKKYYISYNESTEDGYHEIVNYTKWETVYTSDVKLSEEVGNGAILKRDGLYIKTDYIKTIDSMSYVGSYFNNKRNLIYQYSNEDYNTASLDLNGENIYGSINVGQIAKIKNYRTLKAYVADGSHTLMPDVIYISDDTNNNYMFSVSQSKLKYVSGYEYESIIDNILTVKTSDYKYNYDSSKNIKYPIWEVLNKNEPKVEPVTEWSETLSDENIPSEKLVKDTIDSGKLTTTTWSELKELRDNKKLSPGTVYRITDYVCTTVQANTRAKNNLFDILVTALDKETLNENASAIYHEGDTYFTKEALPIWELKYCLDNDTTRFAWADTENGKGVIWYLKDEYENECAYDFKNIQFLRDEAFNTKYSVGVDHYYLTSTDYYYYTFTVINGSKLYDMSCHNTVKAAGVNWKCAKNSILGYSLRTDINTRQLTNNVICGNVSGTTNEKSVYCNTILGNTNTFGGRNVRDNVFMSDVYNNFFADEGYCYGNEFREAQNVIFKYRCFGNIAYTGFSNNTFYGKCAVNNFNGHFSGNTCKGIFSYNIVGDAFQNNTFNQDSNKNNYGHNFIGNVVDCHIENSTFGQDIKYVHFKGDNTQVNYYYIANGLQGTSEDTLLEVTPVPGRTTEYTISRNSTGKVIDLNISESTSISTNNNNAITTGTDGGLYVKQVTVPTVTSTYSSTGTDAVNGRAVASALGTQVTYTLSGTTLYINTK